MSNHAEIWKKLSAINVNPHTATKGKFTYLSWTWAWATLMEEYPDSRYEFQPIQWLPNNTCEVWVRLTVGEVTREMWLAVTDHQNKPVVNPASDLIANCRMRCLVKAIAMFGLGHYIYAGESLPMEVSVEPYTEEQYKLFLSALEADNGLKMLTLSKTLGSDVFTSLAASGAKGDKVKLRTKVNDLIINGGEILEDYVEQIIGFADIDDSEGFNELISELNDAEKKLISKALPPQVLTTIKRWKNES
jgi:hypothetical protein